MSVTTIEEAGGYAEERWSYGLTRHVSACAEEHKMNGLLAHCGTRKITRVELAQIPVPEATKTQQPVAHADLIDALVKALARRKLKVARDEYAVSPNGRQMFGLLDLARKEKDFCYSIGVRNTNDRSGNLALTAGFHVFVCDNMAFRGDFTPFSYQHASKGEWRAVVALAVERVYLDLVALERHIRFWQQEVITERAVKEIIYDAFLTDQVAPLSLMASVHAHYFKPHYPAFAPRTIWSLTNAFTSAFQALPPVAQFRATARFGAFLESYAERSETPLRLPPLAVIASPEIKERRRAAA